MITTYTVNIPPARMAATDEAISRFIEMNCLADVDDALDEIFELGVDAMIARFAPENSIVPNEVCL